MDNSNHTEQVLPKLFLVAGNRIHGARRAAYLFGLVLLFVFSISRFAYDFRRLIYPVNDLTPIWISSQAFVAGDNPYIDTPRLERIWSAANIPSVEGCENYDCLLHKYPMGYPPSALPLLAPFALFSWKAAVFTYLVFSTSLFVAAVLLLAQDMALPWTDPRKLYFVAFAFALSPIHAGIHHSNLNTLVIALLVAAFPLLKNKPYMSGIALAISMCLKPQVAFLFFAYPWIRKQWRAAFTALGGAALLTSCSVLWLQWHHVSVFRAYAAALAEFMPPGGINSFYMDSPQKYTMVNLQVLLFQFTHSPKMSNVIAGALFLIAAAAALLLCSKIAGTNNKIDLALISVLTLLPVYQQIYTAAILTFVVYWAILSLPSKKAVVTLLLMLPLLFPFAARTWTQPAIAGFVNAHNLGSHFIWNAFIMPHVVWIEVLLVVIMLTSLYNASTASRVRPSEAAPSKWA
jgi:hypothetical protein